MSSSAAARLAVIIVVVVVVAQSLTGAVVVVMSESVSEQELCHPTKFDFSLGRRPPNRSSLVPIGKTSRTESSTSRLASVVAEIGPMSQRDELESFCEILRIFPLKEKFSVES